MVFRVTLDNISAMHRTVAYRLGQLYREVPDNSELLIALLPRRLSRAFDAITRLRGVMEVRVMRPVEEGGNLVLKSQ